MNSFIRSAIVASALCGCFTFLPPVLAGNLDPPPGPIVPTGQSILSQATTPVPYVISIPGSYKLTSDLVCSSGAFVVQIKAAGVTLDLNGFTIDGMGTTTVGVDVVSEDVRVHNGRIVDCAGHGVLAVTVSGLVAEDLRVRGCTIGMQISATGRVSRCEIRDCTEYAIFGTTLTIESTRIEACAQVPGIPAIQLSSGVIRDCVIVCASRGIEAVGPATVERCQVSATEIGYLGLNGVIFRGCVATGCDTAGFRLTHSSAYECSALDGAGTGVGFDAVHGAVVDRCTALNNGGHGICVGFSSAITGNTCSGNGAAADTGGIAIEGQYSRVTGNTSTNNLHFNFRCNGLYTAVYGNMASGLGGGCNYVLGVSDVAPITTAAASTSATNNICE